MLDVHVIKKDSLMVGRMSGTLDANLLRESVEFVEVKEVEIESGFHRYCDLTGLKRIQIRLDDVEALADRRRAYNPNLIRVKSAFLATNPLALAIAELYAALLKSPRIEVRTFHSPEKAARWLGVEPKKLAL